MPPFIAARRTSSRQSTRRQSTAKGKARTAAKNSTSAGTAGMAPYEGAAQTRRTLAWKAPTLGPNSAIRSSVGVLRDRSRNAVRNDGNAKAIIDRLVTNIVGDGIKPFSLGPNPEFVAAVHRLWNRWTDESDADGVLPWYGQIGQAVRAWLEGGDCFLRMRPRRESDGLSVPFQVQILEADLCPYWYSLRAPNGNRIRAGIEINGIGKRVAYWMYKEHPGDFNDTTDATLLTSVAADQIVHLFDPLRPGQMRGLPHLHASLVSLYELDKMADATLLRHQLQNMFMAVLKRTGVTAGSPDPLTGLDPTMTAAGDRPVLAMEPGTIQQLDLGEDLVFNDPPDVQGGYAEFSKVQLRAACTATGVPYEVVTGDWSGLNDRIARVILHEFRRMVQATQHKIVAFQVCRRIWRAWMDRAVLVGALPVSNTEYQANPEAWLRVKWSPQSWPYLHPVQDVEASVAAIRAGFTTRADVVAEQGEDTEQIDAQQVIDNKRADDGGLRYDSDGRQAKTPKNSADEAAAPASDGAPPAAAQDAPDPLRAEDIATVVQAAVEPILAELKAAPKGPLVTFARPAMRKRVEYDEKGAIVGFVEEPANPDDDGALRVTLPIAAAGG